MEGMGGEYNSSMEKSMDGIGGIMSQIWAWAREA